MIGCLASLALAASAIAGPVAFFDVQYEATAVAVTSDGPVGFDSQSDPTGATGATASAASVGTTDVATAGAFAGPGVLSTSADVSSTGLGSAVATAWFTGSFLNVGTMNVGIEFDALNFITGTGNATTSLFVSLISDGVTLFSDYVDELWAFTYTPTFGTTSQLSLTLSSEVDAGLTGSGEGNASSFGLVAFVGTVPEAPTLFLVSLALCGVVASGRLSQRGLHSSANG